MSGDLLGRGGDPLEDVSVAKAQTGDVDDLVGVPFEMTDCVKYGGECGLVITLDLARREDRVGRDRGNRAVGGFECGRQSIDQFLTGDLQLASELTRSIAAVRCTSRPPGRGAASSPLARAETSVKLVYRARPPKWRALA